MKNLIGKVQGFILALVFVVLPTEAQTIDTMVEAVSDSALFSTIAGLQGFGTRYCLEGNSSQVSKWVRAQFVTAGLTDVILDSFIYGTTPQSNVVATLPGKRFPEKEIIVGGHMDSYSSYRGNAPGADDDASGTAAVLEIARVLVSSGYEPSATIRFIGFAAEEAGLVGSSHYAEKAKAQDRDIILMLNFDMIGYTSNENPERRFYIVSYPPDTETSALLASAARSYTSLTPVLTTQFQSSVDSYSFAMEGFPAVNCIEYVFNPYYHSPSDLVVHLDSAYARDITRAGIAAILLTDGQLATSAPVTAAVPLVASLQQNYPNPFNPSTIIQYTVGGVEGRVASGEGQVASVRLGVYDLLGREVATLVNERKAPGNYEVQLDGSRLASGVYLYRLAVGSFVQSRTMLLMK